MREILFRGFHKDENGKQKVFVNGEWINGEWVYGDLLHPDFYGNGYSIEDFTKEKNNCFDVIPETVGQYTELTDKNGARIFEGDIIRFDEKLYTVQQECDTPGGYWAETGYILKHIGWSDYISFTSTIDDWENECQVFIVGNIHDNPELLDGAM